MGYHKAKSSADKDMKKPMIWLTNKFNRSPAELMWAKSDKWGPLEGQLLELSYGMGRIFLNLYEKVEGQRQGGQVKLPIEDFKSGVMRGRFNPVDGQLYALGMFAWAANKHEAGAFYRVRYTGKSAYVPTGLHTSKEGLELEFPIALGKVNPGGNSERNESNQKKDHEEEKDTFYLTESIKKFITKIVDGRHKVCMFC